MTSFDYIVVGSGIAGLFAALKAQAHGRVLLLTKGEIEDSNTRYAQGGIAAAISPEDSVDLHLQDTLTAGAGLVDQEAARILVEEAPERIHDLVEFGVLFDSLHGEVALAREGAHSLPRVLHAGGDATGARIEDALSMAASSARIDIHEHTLVTSCLVEAGRCTGVVARTDGEEAVHAARHVILATGGAGQLYAHTTNPEVATGDGVAVAFRAGAEVMDMEFFQFHPTALRLPGAPTFLISEVVRGEGGYLLSAKDGTRFMPPVHPMAELAPRDVVARAILRQMELDGSDHVLLDVRHLSAVAVTARFPQIAQFCKAHGLDITREPIPVSPAAHYMMGGVRTDSWGRTTIPNLYACGEAACTGVHGANRLASNSLLETVVFAERVVEASLAKDWDGPKHAVGVDPPRVLPAPRPAPGGPMAVPDLRALQQLMWRQAGMVRDAGRLGRARETLSAWEALLPEPMTRQDHELASLVLLGRLVVEAALVRTESRGAHFRSDYPEPSPDWVRHVTWVSGE